MLQSNEVKAGSRVSSTAMPFTARPDNPKVRTLAYGGAPGKKAGTSLLAC